MRIHNEGVTRKEWLDRHIVPGHPLHIHRESVRNYSSVATGASTVDASATGVSAGFTAPPSG